MQLINQFMCGHDGDPLEIQNEATSGTCSPQQWFLDWTTGGQSAAGVPVNGYTALTLCPLWQGVNIISGDVGQTPIRLVRNKFDEQKQHPAWKLLRIKPNELQTPLVWKQTMMQWALVWGNGVSWIRRQGSRPVELIPLRPDCVWHELIAFEDREILIYHYQSPYRRSAKFTFLPDDVWHIQGLTSDGVWGYPLWQVGRQTIGQGLSLTKHSTKVFSNGVKTSGVLTHPGKPSPEARAHIRKEFEAAHSGPDNAGRVVLLAEGMEYVPTSMTSVEAQMTEAKTLGILDAASLLNLPPFMLGYSDGAKYNNVEEMNAVYESRTLNSHFRKIDEESRRKLLTEKEWMSDEYQFQAMTSEWLKGDLDTSSGIADRLVKAAILNSNEARDMLGYRPRTGGEVYGSPAINPNENSPSSAGKTPKTPPKPENMAHHAHKLLLYDRLLHLLERESISLKQAASGAKNFVKWLDEFYVIDETKFIELAESVMGTSVSACRSTGIHVEFLPALEKYAKHRHSVMLEVCSGVTKAELPAAVEKLINSETELVAQGLLATALGGESWD